VALCLVKSLFSLVRDNGSRDTIPGSIQLIAARTGQEFNQGKTRKGAYREDRYHATAVDTDEHLVQWLVYIDLNIHDSLVRLGGGQTIAEVQMSRMSRSRP
jgi:hypothetical protein